MAHVTQGITYRRLSPDDVLVLETVAPGLFDNPIDPEQARAFLADPQHEIVLAFDADLAVAMATGTVLLHPDKHPAMFINEVGTRTSHQRRGIGRSVTHCLIGVARARGCKGIWLGTESDNWPAQALYRSMRAEEVAGRFYGWDDAF